MTRHDERKDAKIVPNLPVVPHDRGLGGFVIMEKLEFREEGRSRK